MNRFFRSFAFSLIFVAASSRAAGPILTVIAHKASVYAEPNDEAKVMFEAKKGQKVKAEGSAKKGFYPVKTKAGKLAWISSDDVQAVEHAATPPQAAPTPPPPPPAAKIEPEAPKDDFKRWSIDLGGSSNLSSGGLAYEITLGVNYNIYKWLTWRNAPFYRTQSNSDSVFGLDTSLRGNYTLKLGEELQPQLMLGAGYRIVSVGTSAPIVELGVGIHRSGFGVNVGIKEVLAGLVDDKATNEMLFSLSFSGGTSF